jgi:hypothetical protein
MRRHSLPAYAAPRAVLLSLLLGAATVVRAGQGVSPPGGDGFTWDTRHSAERQRKPAAGQRDPMRRDGGVERAFLAAGKRQRR